MLNGNNWDYFKNKVSKLATFSGCIEIHKIVITYDQVKHGDIIEIASMETCDLKISFHGILLLRSNLLLTRGRYFSALY